MAKKYLDDSGLSYLWGKLKEIFQVKLVSGTNIKTINNNSLLGSGNITISGGGGSVTVDDALSTTSENPVQNKVITNNFDNYLPLTGGTLTGGLKVNGHSTAIGDVVEEHTAASTSVPSGTSTPLMSITLDPGVWVVRVLVRFPAMGTDRTKYCSIHFTTATTTTTYLYRQPCENMITQIPFTQIVSPDTTSTYNVLVYHNSGSDKTFVAGSAIVQNIRAVRIA